GVTISKRDWNSVVCSFDLIFLDFIGVIVNIDSLTLEKKKMCIESIEENVKELKSYLEQNIREKENIPEIPVTGMAALRQQFVLAEAIETWIASVKQGFNRM